MTKKRLSVIGLVCITVLAAIQYAFLKNVPDSMSNFSLVCITNLIGLVILSALRFNKLRTLKRSTLKKGAIFAVELTAMNFFMVLGSRGNDPVVTSSVLSMYFVFITPMLLLLKKKVNFMSGIATVIAIIALLLMFGADTDALFASSNVIYLLLTDFFFAAYVVSVSIMGGDEDSYQLTMTQMLFSIVLSLVGWIIEAGIAGTPLSLPMNIEFWGCALFLGVFIRALYGVVQLAAQKHVSALTASMIFASEILITILLNPLMSRVLHTDYTPATAFQWVGCVFFVIATLLVDEGIMSRLGFSGMDLPSAYDKNGREIPRVSVTKKIIVTTLKCTMLTLVASVLVFLLSIHFIRSSAVENSTTLGENASSISASALTDELESKMLQMAEDKATLADVKLDKYASYVKQLSSYITLLYSYSDSYPAREVQRPDAANAGIWAMQRCLANDGIPYSAVRSECMLLGNLEELFSHISQNCDNVSAIYLGTQSGLMVSFDPHSEDAATEGELYYEFRESSWFTAGTVNTGVDFSETYQDGFGRGLVITCFAPFFDAEGSFRGCVAIDILMNDLNKSMVADGILDPSIATLIDSSGGVIASPDVDPTAEESYNIFDAEHDSPLLPVGKQILVEKDGITSTGEGEEAVYIAYSTMSSTDWTLCIVTPVSSVIGPAVEIRDSINSSTQNVVSAVVTGILLVVQSCLALSALILIAVTFMVGRFSRRIADPLIKLEEDVTLIAKGNFESHTSVESDDEIGSLASSFNMMTDSIHQYMADLREATAQEERIASELSVATRIQSSMLPDANNAFPERGEFAIFADMTPAKEVGGDFYDFFMVDERHIAVVMADVSGKGVPAALFMVIAKTLIKDNTVPGKDLGEVFSNVNSLLCESNSEGLFVTAFEGVLDLVTGELNFVNAGHEMPYIYRAGGAFEAYKIRPGFVLAGMEDMRFKSGSLTLNVGDKLFQYTDGVTEATNSDNELYGMERLGAILNREKSASPEKLLPAVRADIEAFVGDAPQFDDITMLCLEVKGRMAE